jgi:hypothetical protein
MICAAESTIVAIPCGARLVYLQARQRQAGVDQRLALGCVWATHLRGAAGSSSRLCSRQPQVCTAALSRFSQRLRRGSRWQAARGASAAAVERCHRDPSPGAQTARPTFQSHRVPSTRLALSRLRAVCSPCRLCWLRARTVPEGCEARDSFPDGPTALRSAAAESIDLDLHRRRPAKPMRPSPRLLGASHLDVYPQWNVRLPGQLTGTHCTVTATSFWRVLPTWETAPAGCCCHRSRLPFVSWSPVRDPETRGQLTTHQTANTAILLHQAAPTARIRALARSVGGASVGTTLPRSRLDACFWKTARISPSAVSQMPLEAFSPTRFQLIKRSV